MRPIVILAAPFSGASWLAGVLGTLNGASAAPQLFPYLADQLGELLEIFRLGQDEHGDGLLRLVAQLYCGGQHSAAIAAARQWLEARESRSVAEVLEEIAASVAPERLLYPDCETPLRPIYTRRLLRTHPDADLVHLVRHPWSQGVRFAAWLRECIFVPTDFRDYSLFPPCPDPQIAWLRANENIERLIEQWPADRVHRVRSEDLDQDLQGSVDQLAQRLGLNGRVGDPSRWPYAQRGGREAPGGLEADVWAELPEADEQLATQLSMSAPLPWRPDGAGFADEVKTLARRYGYE